MITKFTQVNSNEVYKIADETKPITGNYGNREIGCCALGCLKLYVKEQSKNPKSNIYIMDDYYSWYEFTKETFMTRYEVNNIVPFIFTDYNNKNTDRSYFDAQILVSLLNDYESRELALFVLENFLNW